MHTDRVRKTKIKIEKHKYGWYWPSRFERFIWRSIDQCQWVFIKFLGLSFVSYFSSLGIFFISENPRKKVSKNEFKERRRNWNLKRNEDGFGSVDLEGQGWPTSFGGRASTTLRIRTYCSLSVSLYNRFEHLRALSRSVFFFLSFRYLVGFRGFSDSISGGKLV